MDDFYLRRSLIEADYILQRFIIFPYVCMAKGVRVGLCGCTQVFVWGLTVIYSVSVLFLQGCQSRGQIPGTRGTSRTMILDHLWNTPLDINRSCSSHIQWSFNVCFSQLSTLLSCHAVPLSASHLHFTLYPSSPLLLPAGSKLTLRKAALTNMDGYIFSATEMFKSLFSY